MNRISQGLKAIFGAIRLDQKPRYRELDEFFSTTNCLAKLK